MSDHESSAASVVSGVWQRCSLWALLPLLIRAVVQWAGVILGGVVVSLQKSDGYYMPWMVAGLAIFICGHTVLHWRFTQFRVLAHGVELRRGVLQKEHLQLANSRVQELQVQQPFYYRPLQLYAVSLDSAGSHKQEFYLTGLNTLQLRQLQGGAVLEDRSPSTPFFRIWLATLYNKHLWLPLLAVLGAAQSQLNSQLVELWQQGQNLFEQSGLQHNLMLQLAGLLGLLLLALLILVLMTWIWLYPQHFVRSTQQLQLMQGTLFKKSLRIQLKRVQMISVIQPWLARLLGHYSLVFHGFTNSGAQKTNFVLLGQTMPDITNQLQAQQLLTLAEMQALSLQRYPAPYFERLFLIRFGLWLMCAAVLAVLAWFSWMAPPTALLIAVTAACWFAVDGWAYRRWHGFILQDQVLYLWRGGLSQSWQCLPLHQVQKVQLVQSWFFKKQQLVGLNFITANGTLTLAAVPNLQAQTLYAQVLELLQLNTES